MEKFRSRKFCAVLYPEDVSHLNAVRKLQSEGYNFAAVLHNRDLYEDGEHKGQLKKQHWHIVVKFKNAIWNTALAKDLGIAENYIEECKSIDGNLLYMVHEGYPEKAQYDVEEVFGPLSVRLSSLLAEQDEGTRVLNVCDIIESSGPLSFQELIRKSVAAGVYGDLIRMGWLGKGLLEEHNARFDLKQSMYGVEQDARTFCSYEAHTGNKDILPL